jgi:hypothetical protein
VHDCLLQGQPLPPLHHPSRRAWRSSDPARTASDLLARLHHLTTETHKAHGLNGTDKPFWANLPYTNIFTCLTPDLLHQFHRGVFKDHLLLWCETILGSTEMDQRFTVMPKHQDMIYFPHGVTNLTQTTGRQHKNMEKVFVGIVNGCNADVVLAATALLDFIQLASLPAHTDASITALDEALARFHRYKAVFVELGGRNADHFDLNKVHSLVHYAESIRLLGSLDGYNTEWSERMHIKLVKLPFEGTNGHRTYLQQMRRWLERHEKVLKYRSYLNWRIPKYAESKVHVPKMRGRNAVTDADDASSEAVDSVDSAPSQEVARTRITQYVVAQVPPWPSCTPNDLATRFGCTQFLPTFQRYLSGRGLDRPLLADNDAYTVYTRVSQLHPSSNSAFAASIPNEHNRAGPHPHERPNFVPSFDTVLITHPDRPASEDPTKGLCSVAEY